MAPATQIVLSGMLTFGVPLLLAVRELFVLRRPPGGSPPDEPPPHDPTPLPPDFGYGRPLPACLIPKRLPDRVLEPA